MHSIHRGWNLKDETFPAKALPKGLKVRKSESLKSEISILLDTAPL
jgi:hypothetical protein